MLRHSAKSSAGYRGLLALGFASPWLAAYVIVMQALQLFITVRQVRGWSVGLELGETSAGITLSIYVQPSLPERMFKDVFGPRKFSRKSTKDFVLKALQENALSDCIFRDLRQEILVNRGLEGPELTNEVDRQSKAFWGGRGEHKDSQPHRKIVDERKSIELYKLIRVIYKNLFAIRQVTRDLGQVSDYSRY